MKKKANSQATVVWLIFAVLLLVIVFFYIDRVNKISEEKINNNVCKASVEAVAKSGIKPIGYIQEFQSIINARSELVTDIDCPTEPIEITSGDMSNNAEKAKQKISKATCDCWDKFWRGRFELFEIKADTDMYCVICNHITFEDRTEDIDGFFDYYKKSPYFSCVSGYETSETFIDDHPEAKNTFDELAKNKGLDTLDTSKDYAVAYIYFKDGHDTTIVRTIKGAAIGIAAGAVIGVVTVFTMGTATIPTIALFAGGVGTSAGMFAHDNGDGTKTNYKSRVALIPFDEQSLKELGCTYLPAKQTNAKKP